MLVIHIGLLTLIYFSKQSRIRVSFFKNKHVIFRTYPYHLPQEFQILSINCNKVKIQHLIKPQSDCTIIIKTLLFNRLWLHGVLILNLLLFIDRISYSSAFTYNIIFIIQYTILINWSQKQWYYGRIWVHVARIWAFKSAFVKGWLY